MRLALEPYMTRLAVLNATARDVDRLVSDLDKQLQGKAGAEITREGVERNLRLLATLGLLAA